MIAYAATPARGAGGCRFDEGEKMKDIAVVAAAIAITLLLVMLTDDVVDALIRTGAEIAILRRLP
jgi:hypothetical protein